MEHLFFDRVTGSSCLLPTKFILLGQIKYASAHEDMYCNNIPLNTRDYLVPGKDLSIVITGQDNEENKYDARFLLPNSAITYINQLEALANLSSSWPEWDNYPVLDPNIKESICIQALDRSIDEKLKHLQNICKQPNTHLTLNLEKVPVGYARRFKSRTYSYLASHTEDWERRTLNSVFPKRILSIRTEELWKTYENIATARLIDRLLGYIKGRIKDVEADKMLIKNASDFTTKLAHNHYALQNRLSKIWGDMVDTQSALEQAKNTLSYLENLKIKISKLTDSTLYRQIPKSAQVYGKLRKTNLFVYDQEYQFVAQLWHEEDKWKSGVDPKQTPLQTFKSYQILCKNFSTYCALLIYRALTQLKFKVVSTGLFRPNNTPVKFSNGVYELELFWNQDDILSIQSEGVNIISFVPLPIHFSKSILDNDIHEVIDLLAGDKKGNNNSDDIVPLRIILYHGKDEDFPELPEKYKLKLYSFGRLSSEGMGQRHGLLPISPLDLFSVERIGRAIRWATLDKHFSLYPRKSHISSFIKELDLDTFKWLQVKNGFCEILELPSADERNRFFTRLEIIRRSEETKKRQVRRNLKILTDFKLSIEINLNKTKVLYHCPICGKEIHPRSFAPMDQGLFKCRCIDPSCQAIWETRQCTKCLNRYPVLLPGSTAGLLSDKAIGWVDKLLGEDVLSFPNPDTLGDQVTFICPRCGENS